MIRILKDKTKPGSTEQLGLLDHLADEIYKYAYDIQHEKDPGIDGSNALFEKVLEVMFGGDTEATKLIKEFVTDIIRCTNFITNISSHTKPEALQNNLARVDKHFVGKLEDVSNVLENQQAKICIEALLGLIRFDAVSGKWSPDFDKIRPLAEQLGCFDHISLNHVLGLINNLSGVFGADGKLMNAYDIQNAALPEMSVSITKELSKQLMEQQTKLYPKAMKSISDTVSIRDLPYAEFVRKLYRFIDVDNNGHITFEEFTEMLYQLRLDISVEQAALLFAKFDEDGKGVISEEEFDLNFHHITDIMVEGALVELNITKITIIRLLVLMITLLILIATFVLLGITAFTTGTNFGAVINSILPVLASTALYSQGGGDVFRQRANEFRECVILAVKKVRVNRAV